MRQHGRVWWLTYRDAAGEVHYENSNTADAAEAQRILARKAMPRAKAMVQALKAIVDGTPYQGETQARAGAPRQAAGRGAKAARANRQGTGKGGTR